jgi:exodeoxyribonuclease V alpha subunit
VFKEYDKVIQLVNSSELQIMNGDIGIITNQAFTLAEGKEKVTYNVDFTEVNVKLEQKDFENLNLAYTISIHKSQGSEYRMVILPMFKSYSIMLKRKLIYTAITRAKEKLIIVGDIEAFYQGLYEIEKNRQTSLAEKISNNSIIKVGKKKINDPEIPFDELGEINMEGITPYSFM